MRIGIDIDQTLTDTEKSFFEVMKKYEIKYALEYKEWRNCDVYNLILEHISEILANAELKENATNVVNELAKTNQIYVITARSNRYAPDIIDTTKKFIKENNLHIDKIYFRQSNKAKLCKKLNIDLMIDDKESVCKMVKELGIDCILFGDKIKTWKDVLKYVKDKENGNG